jgi:pantothenate kinase
VDGVESRQRPLSELPRLAWAQVRARAVAASRGDGRTVIGITGPPGAGKSTLSSAIVEAVQREAPGSCVLVGMDGWHLANDVLTRLGTVARKGAPDTFDGAGYVDALERLRRQRHDDPPIWLPEFRRSIEDAVAGAVEVRPEHRLIVTEGNYLLLDTAPWDRVRSMLDMCWYVDVPDELRLERLAARHAHFGRSLDEAEHRARVVDQSNAALVEAVAGRADAVVGLDDVHTTSPPAP